MTDKLTCSHCGQAIPQAGGIYADRLRMEVRFRGVIVTLTSQEFDLFAFLLERVGRVVTKEALLDLMYQLEDDDPEIKIIDVFICKIRAKLKGLGVEIRTHWGRGYSIEPPKEEPNDGRHAQIDAGPLAGEKRDANARG